MIDYTEYQREIAAVFGFSPEEIDGIIGPFYGEAHRRARLEYEETKQRMMRRASAVVTDEQWSQ